jgi:hypothetical protein
MRTKYGHLTYCTNIHSGETWADHFESIKKFIPQIKAQVSPHQPFGIGLRISNQASLELINPEVVKEFQHWLDQEDCYVFTMNGFPYGGFHHTIVKDAVHKPDWTTPERVDYTERLATILAALLPPGMEGGISTSPLSYRHWFNNEKKRREASSAGTMNILQVVNHLVDLKKNTGKTIHLDIEPEPGGLIENGREFIDWYEDELLPSGIASFKEHLGMNEIIARETIREHVQLCYDVCHFAIGFEDAAITVKQLEAKGIKIGKIQISAALKAAIPANAEDCQLVMEAFGQFNEPTYLHQVVALLSNGKLIQYNDLPDALNNVNNDEAKEWRSHFHVPLFIKDYGMLQSTQQDIIDVLAIQQERPFTSHMEIETYTWEVLPEALKLPLGQSIVREMEWVTGLLNGEPSSKNTNNGHE